MDRNEIFSNGYGPTIATAYANQKNLVEGASDPELNLHYLTGQAAGIYVLAGTSNRFTANSIYGNRGLGISLKGVDDGNLNQGTVSAPVLNDLDDSDTGPNNRQNFPILASADYDAGGMTVTGYLPTLSRPQPYVIDLYANHACDPSGYGEGEKWMASFPLNVGSLGSGDFIQNLELPDNGAFWLTATATDPDGNTSESSPAILIQGVTRTFPNKGISDTVQQQGPGGSGSLHSVGADSRGNLQLQGGAGALAQSALATGDGNGDGIQDFLQANVVSFPSIAGKWITLASPTNTALENVVPSGPPDFTNLPAGYTFPLGFVNFSATGLTPAGSIIVTNFFHDDIDYDTVFAYGPTPDNPSPHWHEFLFDGTVGAKLDLNGFTLTFIDGGVGDHDLKTDGKISTTLAAAHRLPPAPPLQLLSATAERVDGLKIVNAAGETIGITNGVLVATTVLAWPALATNCLLEATDSLSPTNFWQTIFATPAVLNNQFIVTNSTADTTRYYRLRKF